MKTSKKQVKEKSTKKKRSAVVKETKARVAKKTARKPIVKQEKTPKDLSLPRQLLKQKRPFISLSLRLKNPQSKLYRQG